jgi:hypothetical protein
MKGEKFLDQLSDYPPLKKVLLFVVIVQTDCNGLIVSEVKHISYAISASRSARIKFLTSSLSLLLSYEERSMTWALGM